jgi:hypothetical protein
MSADKQGFQFAGCCGRKPDGRRTTSITWLHLARVFANEAMNVSRHEAVSMSRARFRPLLGNVRSVRGSTLAWSLPCAACAGAPLHGRFHSPMSHVDVRCCAPLLVEQRCWVVTDPVGGSTTVASEVAGAKRAHRAERISLQMCDQLHRRLTHCKLYLKGRRRTRRRRCASKYRHETASRLRHLPPLSCQNSRGAGQIWYGTNGDLAAQPIVTALWTSVATPAPMLAPTTVSRIQWQPK